jgi:hypothetical protein
MRHVITKKKKRGNQKYGTWKKKEGGHIKFHKEIYHQELVMGGD